ESLAVDLPGRDVGLVRRAVLRVLGWIGGAVRRRTWRRRRLSGWRAGQLRAALCFLPSPRFLSSYALLQSLRGTRTRTRTGLVCVRLLPALVRVLAPDRDHRCDGRVA